MITVTWQSALVWLLAVCGGFSTICVAVGWLIKIVKSLKKPADDVKARLDGQDQKLANDNERLKKIESTLEELREVQPMILRSEYVILQHMRTNNSTGEIAKQEEAINNYLFNRK